MRCIAPNPSADLCGALAGARTHGLTYYPTRGHGQRRAGVYALLVACWRCYAQGCCRVHVRAGRELAGSTRVSVLLDIDPSLVGVLQGILVMMILISMGVRQRLAEQTGGAA